MLWPYDDNITQTKGADWNVFKEELWEVHNI